MKKWQTYSIIALLVSSVGLSETASHADEIEDLKKKLQFLEAQKEIVTKLDSMQLNIDGLRGKIDAFQKQLHDIRVQYDIKVSTPSKPAPQEEAQSASKKVNFEWIMDSLSKEKRSIGGMTGGPHLFSFSKNRDEWIIAHTLNGLNSPVRTGGDNKLVWNDLPFDWPINGTWIFKKAASICKLNHESKNYLKLKWKCG